MDEYGTAGAGPLYLGAVLVLARDAGQVDKAFTDLLEPNVNEVHAVRPGDGYLQGLLQRFWLAAPAGRVVLLNQGAGVATGLPSAIYAQAVVQTVKAGLRRFKGVEHVARIDSAASRLLQLADCVAYSRKWIANGEVNARGLRERFGIELP